MALPAAAIAALLAGAQSAASNAGAFTPLRTAKRNRERVKELERLAAADALGLTDEEREALLRPLVQQGEQVRSRQRATREAILAGTDRGAQSLLASALADEAEARSLERAGALVGAADVERKRELERELDARLAALDEVRRQRVAAAGQVVADALGAGATTKLQGIFGLGAHGGASTSPDVPDADIYDAAQQAGPGWADTLKELEGIE